jgi:glyoxylase-like metal-dependent hydrolase (beta-lactamase superfamily II)
MRQVQPDLWETEVESPFPGLTTHAYLYQRVQGNVLFYNTSQQADIAQFAELGGVAYQLLSHRDEVGESLALIRERFQAKLGIHQQDQEALSEVLKADLVFTDRQALLDDVEIIPTPGHTPGSVCFLVQSLSGKRYLFTGDTLYLSDWGWQPGMLSFSDKTALAESLNLLQTLQPDLVISSAYSGQTAIEVVTGQWAEKVKQAMAKLEKFESD